jgi:hypothetical protein
MANQYVHDLKAMFGLYRETCAWFSQLGFDWVVTRYGNYERHFADFEAYAACSDSSSVSLEFKQAFDTLTSKPMK